MRLMHYPSVFVIAVLLSAPVSAQQFAQEWEFSDWLTYVGDIDGNGVGGVCER